MKHADFRRILITGASDGIGLALTRRYAVQPARLLLVGRRPLDTLDPHIFTPQTYCRCNLALPEAAGQIRDFVAASGWITLDLLVHNAAIGAYGPITEQSPAAVRELLAVNLRAPINLSQALLPWLRPVAGKIVFISSVAAQLPAPDYAVYAASKAALEGFARSLRSETGGLAVQVIRPGATRTAMHARSGVPADRIAWDRFPPAEQVAAKIERAIAGTQPLVTIGAGNRLLADAGRHLPALVDWLTARGRR
jgi:short-subunit dehydrogenase